MSSTASGPSPSLLSERLGLGLDEFIALPPDRRADAARRTVSDLHAFVQGAGALETRGAPQRTLELAQGLASALDREGLGSRPDSGQRLITDNLLREECDRDQNVYLGRLFTRYLTRAVPDLVFQPVDAQEVGALFRWARDIEVPVTIRGAATTAMGGAIPGDAGVVLDLSRLDTITFDTESGVVRIGAGVRMRPLHAALHQRGRCLPLYPSNLGGTYAGWLATGGIGLNAFRSGRAIDAVRSAEVVLPTGDLVRILRGGELEVPGSTDRRKLTGSEAEDWLAERGLPRLGLADLAGSEGQFGVLVSLELETAALDDQAAFLLVFASPEDALAAVGWITAGAGKTLPTPGDLKFLSAGHLHHVRRVWQEEDGKEWRRQPGRLSLDDQLPWRRVLGPVDLGAPEPTDTKSEGAFVFVNFASEEEGRRFAVELSSCPGNPGYSNEESVRLARDRFRPQQVKRFGPAFLAAEIQLPADQVAGFRVAAEKLANDVGPHLDLEVYYLADGNALALAAYLTDHRRASFAVELSLAPALLDLAMARFGGSPYVLGRWQANLFPRKFGRTRANELKALKSTLDPYRLVNRGSFFDMGLRTPLGNLLMLAIGPMVRLLRWTYGALPPLTSLAKRVLARFPGPSAGRGIRADEAFSPGDRNAESANATGRALHCVNCGECNSVCPIFHESKVRLPQILTHLGEAAHGGGGLGDSGTSLLDLCMRCGNCEEVCQSGIPHLPIYDALQRASDEERPHDRERHVLLLERLRASTRYTNDFLGARTGGYLQRAPVALPGSARFILQRAEKEAGPAATCIHCGACVDVCPTAANREFEGDDPRWITTLQDRCIGCGTCVEVCPANHANGGQTLRVMEAPTFNWIQAATEFAQMEQTR